MRQPTDCKNFSRAVSANFDARFNGARRRQKDQGSLRLSRKLGAIIGSRRSPLAAGLCRVYYARSALPYCQRWVKLNDPQEGGIGIAGLVSIRVGTGLTTAHIDRVAGLLWLDELPEPVYKSFRPAQPYARSSQLPTLESSLFVGMN